MSEVQHHHHHHHHHSQRRKQYLRRQLRESILIGICVVAALCILLIMYCGMKDNPNLGHLLMLALPAFGVIGAIVAVVRFFIMRRNYDKARS